MRGLPEACGFVNISNCFRACGVTPRPDRPVGETPLAYGRRRRYICKACGATFTSTLGSAYHRLKALRQQVDQACHMSAEGVNISVIS